MNIEAKKTEQHEQSPLRSLGSSWYQALTFNERLALLRTRSSGGLHVDEYLHRDEAERKLSWWKELPPFEKGTFFADRLAFDHLTEEELLFLLAEPAEEIQKQCPSQLDWADILIRLYELHNAPGENPPEQAKRDQSQFLSLVEPLLHDAWDRLQEHLTSLLTHYTHVPFNSVSLTNMLFPHLTSQILTLVYKTLVLELHIARLRGYLQGNTSEERFDDFVHQYTQPAMMLALLEKYPVLARQLVTTVETWDAVMYKFAQRLCQDWSALCKAFFPTNDPGQLSAVQTNAGDLHRGGQSVFILEFSSGLQLVYKPRSLSLDRHFQEILLWINDSHILPPLQIMRFVEGEGYGWSEYNSVSECKSEEEVERFYIRLGAYLALLHTLTATDFHGENLLAVGEQPILIDVESLFHPHIALPDGQDKMEDPAARALRTSVLSVALLPQRIWSTDQMAGIDLSGMGHTAGQIFPHPVALWKARGTDQMRLERDYAPMLGKKNRPRLNGQDVDMLHYQQPFCQGFTAMYRLLLAKREEFPTVMLPRFAQDEVRIIMRPTLFYSLLLQESYHPDVLRDALDQYRYLDRLWAITEVHPPMRGVVAAERADLLAGDIPFFWTYSTSRDLYTSQNERIAGFFASSGLESARERLCTLDEQDLARQIWIIQASFATLPLADHTGLSLHSLHPLPPQNSTYPTQQARLLQAACSIGDRLCTLAIHGDESINWIGISLVNECEWKLTPTRDDLYNGLPGIAFFLAYLGVLADKEHYTTLARLIVQTLQKRVEQSPTRAISIGVFSGIGSLLYLFTHLGILWDDPPLLQAATQIAERIESLFEQDEQLDIVSGVAGCILALLNLYEVAPASHLLEGALRGGNHLMQRFELGVSGGSPQPEFLRQQGLLTGFSHGAAGMAVSLHKLARVSGETQFSQAAEMLLSFERALFSVPDQNWPDLRDRSAFDRLMKRTPQPSGEDPSYMTAWCHGAAGIALSRMELFQTHAASDPYLMQEITSAIQTTLHTGFGHNHSLCHGDLGNIEVLLMAVQRCGLTNYMSDLIRLTEEILARGETQGWLSGIPLGVETPGLMLGLAGIGYQLLRLSCPDKCPCLLLVAPPFRRENC